MGEFRRYGFRHNIYLHLLKKISSETIESIALVWNFVLSIPVHFLHRMLCHVVVNDDVLFIWNRRTVACDDCGLPFFQFHCCRPRILAVNFVRVVSDDPFFIQSSFQFHRSESYERYLGFSRPTTVN